MRFLQTSIAAALVGFGTVAASPAWAVSNSIESIIGAQQGSTTQVRIRMGMPLTEVPASFSLANPHRLALDFKDTDNRIGRSLVELTGGDVKSVNVVQGGERARVVLNMTRPMRFKSEIEGNDLILSLDRQESVEATPAARWQPAAHGGAGQQGGYPWCGWPCAFAQGHRLPPGQGWRGSRGRQPVG